MSWFTEPFQAEFMQRAFQHGQSAARSAAGVGEVHRWVNVIGTATMSRVTSLGWIMINPS